MDGMSRGAWFYLALFVIGFAAARLESEFHDTTTALILLGVMVFLAFKYSNTPADRY